MENRLSIDVKYTLDLLDVSLNHSKDTVCIDNKLTDTNFATILCSNKMCIIPALTETSFTVRILKSIEFEFIFILFFIFLFLDWYYSPSFWSYKCSYKT